MDVIGVIVSDNCGQIASHVSNSVADGRRTQEELY